MSKMKGVSVIGLLALLVSKISAGPGSALPNCSSGPLSSNKVCDTTASPRDRATALVSAMEVSEKLANLVSKSPGVPRLNLPPYNWWSEALHGVAGAPGIDFSGEFSKATSFPMPLLMAAAFDDDLIEKIAVVIGTESRAFGNNNHSGIDYWTPDVNPFRDPRWGRGSETPGEDIARIKGYTASLLRGLEGPKKQRQIIATCKHYVGYDMEAWGGVDRHNFDAKITPQELAEYYMQPFQQCARDSKVGSIMCSYNRVNGVPACADPYIMGTILREHWNWTESNNYITSDCEAVADVSQNHHYAETLAQGTAMCFNAGMDLSCEYESSSDIPGAWSSGALNETTVDRALVRLYEGLVRAGFFDGAAADYASLGASDIDTPVARSLALQSATDGIVLLKNDKTLPLNLPPKAKLAMIGFWANDTKKLQGIYSGPPPYLRTPVEAALKLGYTVNVATGPILQSSGDQWTADAVAAAKKSDVILYFGGLDTSAAAEGFDRTSIAWPGAQLALLKTLATTVKKPLVVIQLGDQVDNTPLLKEPGVNSILWANWPGQDGGPAVMSLITGAKAPAGRLPVTQYPANYTELPMTDMNLRPSGTSPGRTYRWYPSAVQPFGTGLHYTTFKPSFGKFGPKLSIQELLSGCSKQYPDTCPLPSLPVQVKNTGRTKSDFVALAFVAAEVGPKPYPIKTLVTYGRLRDIAPGATAKAALPWTIGHLARHNAAGDTVIYPGTYTLMLDQPTQTTMKFTLTGKEVVLDKWPAPPK